MNEQWIDESIGDSNPFRSRKFISEWNEARLIRDLAHNDGRAYDWLSKHVAKSISESVGDYLEKDISPEQIKEATTTSAAFPYLLGTSLYRQLESAYKSVTPAWQKIVRKKSIANFKTQERIRISEGGDLLEVPENTEYKDMELEEKRAHYKIKKYGRKFGLTFEAETNDDLGGLTDIATKMGRAAARLIDSSVFAILTANAATTYDGITLMHLTSHGANLTTNALSEANLATGIAQMVKQTDAQGNPINIGPRYLITSPDLAVTAARCVKSPFYFGTTTTDAPMGSANPLSGIVEILDPRGIAWLTTATDWMLLADPADAPVIEVGFLNGVEAPAIFRQKTETGTDFDRDATQWKVRLIFGVIAVDHVGVYGRT